MPSLADNIFIFILALLLFGPKRLPKLAREMGKWIGEFRRASADFRAQMDDELRISDQAEKQKSIAAMAAASPVGTPAEAPPVLTTSTDEGPDSYDSAYNQDAGTAGSGSTFSASQLADPESHDVFPIATSGELTLMPPATGLPAQHTLTPVVSPASPVPPITPPAVEETSTDAFGSLMTSIPQTATVPAAEHAVEAEATSHV